MNFLPFLCQKKKKQTSVKGEATKDKDDLWSIFRRSGLCVTSGLALRSRGSRRTVPKRRWNGTATKMNDIVTQSSHLLFETLGREDFRTQNSRRRQHRDADNQSIIPAPSSPALVPVPTSSATRSASIFSEPTLRASFLWLHLCKPFCGRVCRRLCKKKIMHQYDARFHTSTSEHPTAHTTLRAGVSSFWRGSGG